MTIKPSKDVKESGDSFDRRFDYEIDMGDGQRPMHISMMKGSQDEQDDIAYRYLNAIGVACSGSDGAFIYISLAVYGSTKDFFFTGLHLGAAQQKLLALGKSGYGVLAINSHDPFQFSIWDSNEETEANSMQQHDYRISRFLWIDEKQGAGYQIQSLGSRRRNQLFPGCLLGEESLSIRIGEPRTRCK